MFIEGHFIWRVRLTLLSYVLLKMVLKQVYRVSFLWKKLFYGILLFLSNLSVHIIIYLLMIFNQKCWTPSKWLWCLATDVCVWRHYWGWCQTYRRELTLKIKAKLNHFFSLIDPYNKMFSTSAHLKIGLYSTMLSLWK